MKQESLIGKQYMPRDNSYSRNLSNSRTYVRLSGVPYTGQQAQVTTIKSEPFEVINTDFSTPSTHKFVLVETDTQETYFVMYHEHGLITETNTVESILQSDVQRFLDIMSI